MSGLRQERVVRKRNNEEAEKDAEGRKKEADRGQLSDMWELEMKVSSAHHRVPRARRDPELPLALPCE